MPVALEQPGARPSGLLRRLGAMLYDTLLVIAVLATTVIVLTGLNRTEAVHGRWLTALLFLEVYGFFAWFWMYRGQTLGMLAWRLQVRSAGGGPITWTQATLRFLGAIASLACLGLGWLWVLVDREKRSWSDLLSGSRVLHVPRAGA